MKKILFTSDPAAGNGSPAANPTATPPAAAETVAGGMSEREALLAKENIKLRAAVSKTAEGKRRAEETAAHALRQAEQLKQQQQQQAAKQKSSWLWQ